MRKIFALVIAGMASWTAPVAAKEPATDATYVCELDGKPTVYLNITRHRFRFADQAGPLHEGQNFSFTTGRGYTMTIALGDPGRLRINRPEVVDAIVTVSGNGEAPERQDATCGLSGAAMAKQKVPAKSASEVEALKSKWADANGWCRGGSGAASDRGCALRDRLDKQLEARGQCYSYEIGKGGGHDSVWRKCP
jgi:hypothetical protein